jgi:hypothetical protein
MTPAEPTTSILPYSLSSLAAKKLVCLNALGTRACDHVSRQSNEYQTCYTDIDTDIHMHECPHAQMHERCMAIAYLSNTAGNEPDGTTHLGLHVADADWLHSFGEEVRRP